MTTDWDGGHSSIITDEDSGLSTEDLSGIHFIQRGGCGRSGKVPVPAFALHLPSVQRVLLARAWAFCHSYKPMPAEIDRLALDKQCTEIVLDCYFNNLQDHRISFYPAIVRAGSYMNVTGSILYRAWRLFEPVPEIAAAFDSPTQFVSEQLRRMERTAVRLGLVAYPWSKPAKVRIPESTRRANIKATWESPTLRAAKAESARNQKHTPWTQESRDRASASARKREAAKRQKPATDKTSETINPNPHTT